MRKTLLWSLSFAITVFFALFQRVTGPTYPVKGGGVEETPISSFRLPRSCTVGGSDCLLAVRSDSRLEGYAEWKRYKTGDAPRRLVLAYKNGVLSGRLPDQPPAGKLEYRVFVQTGGGKIELSKGPVVTRFRGEVPSWILIPHILLMFLFLLFSVRIFLSVFTPGLAVRHAAVLNLVFLLLGGFLFGPLTQYYAFGQAWTGFPSGYDLTDNKTLLMLLAWLPALYTILKGRNSRLWVTLAFIVTFAVYLVPHSLFGSELDYQKGEVVTGN